MGERLEPFGGVVHELPTDLREVLLANATALDAWNDITPLARNEFICWVEDAKKAATRARRIRRTQEELEEGQRRPCVGPGASTATAQASSAARASRLSDKLKLQINGHTRRSLSYRTEEARLGASRNVT